MSKMFKLLITLFSVFISGESARILGYFATPAISHQVVFRPVMIELAKRGHEVTYITSDLAFPNGGAPENYTEIDVHDISYAHWNQWIADYGHIRDPIENHRLLCNLFLTVVEIQLKSEQVQKLLKENRKFDLVIVESYIRPSLILSHVYNAPVIEFSSLSGIFTALESVGAAAHPLIYPNPVHRRVYNLSLWDKIKKLYIHYRTYYTFMEHASVENEALKRIFGPDIPDILELRQRVQLLFLNIHPIMDFNRPVPPNVVYLGNLHEKPPKELSQEWKNYLDSSKHGVIYVSFGTNVKPSMFPAETLKIFTDVFSKLPYDVLWKWDKDELPNRPKNVRIEKWLPQSDLLRHPNVKLYILQGGLQSTEEALTAGVPLIGVPMLGDQWFNVEQYVKFGIGKEILIETMTEEELMGAIKTVIEDKSYRQNAEKLRNIIRDQPEKPLDRAIWWIEYVLRHGPEPHLRAPGASVHWTEYYVMDVVIALLAAFLLAVAVIYFVIKSVVNYVKRLGGKVKTN